jgi:hypothetical protein
VPTLSKENVAFIFTYLGLIFNAEGIRICTKFLQKRWYLPPYPTTRRHVQEHSNLRSYQWQTSRYYSNMWLRSLDAGVWQRRPGFNSGPVYMVENEAIGQVFSEYVGFPLSVSFHRWPMLIHPSVADAIESHQRTASLKNTKNYVNYHSLIICWSTSNLMYTEIILGYLKTV